MVTLKDIAKLAGLSAVSVSRILNQRNKEVRATAIRRAEKVRRIAAQLGFRPNAAARAVQGGKFRQVACATTMFAVREGTGTGGGFGDYLTGIALELAGRGYSALFEPFLLHPDTCKLMQPPKFVSELLVDGVLGISAAGVDMTSVDLQLKALRVPIVWINRNPQPRVVTVLADEQINGRMLAEHLLELGHRRIGYVGYATEHYSIAGRQAGVRKALKKAGADASALLFPKKQVMQRGLAIRQIFDRKPALTALICENRLWVDAAMQEASHRGLAVPGNIKLACFSSPTQINIEIPVVYLEIPEPEMARKGARILLDLIAGKQPPRRIEPISGRLITG